MSRDLCQHCHRSPQRSIYSPPGEPEHDGCLLLRFWTPTADEPDSPAGNQWLRVFTEQESDEMYDKAASAHQYQEGGAGCSAHVEVNR